MAKKKVEKGETPSAAKVMQERPCDKCRNKASDKCEECGPEHADFELEDPAMPLLKKVLGLDEPIKTQLFDAVKKKVNQMNLEGEKIEEHIIEDEETVIAHFRFFRHGSFYLRIKDEALEKLLTQKKKESEEDFQDRVLSTVQKRVKISCDVPVGREEYDAAWTKIFDRLFEI